MKSDSSIISLEMFTDICLNHHQAVLRLEPLSVRRKGDMRLRTGKSLTLCQIRDRSICHVLRGLPGA